jgi:hypothetical protein
VVDDGHGIVLVDGDIDRIAMTGEMFVDRIVDDLPDAMVKGRPIVGVTKVHSRSFSHCFKALEDLNAVCTVVGVGHKIHFQFRLCLEDPLGVLNELFLGGPWGFLNDSTGVPLKPLKVDPSNPAETT